MKKHLKNTYSGKWENFQNQIIAVSTYKKSLCCQEISNLFPYNDFFFFYESAWKWVRDKGKQPTPTCMADKLELLWCKNCLGWEEFACLEEEEEEWDSSFPFTCEVEFWLVDGGMGGVWLTTCRVISFTSLNFSINCTQYKESVLHV